MVAENFVAGVYSTEVVVIAVDTFELLGRENVASVEYY